MNIETVFVYGTLKRGFSRQTCWPTEPLSVRHGFVQGHLLDVGPYPGLLAGTNWVRGELWRLSADDVVKTLAALDEVEGCFGDKLHDLYRRVTIDVFATPCGERMAEAYVYLLNNSQVIESAQPIEPSSYQDQEIYAEWPASSKS